VLHELATNAAKYGALSRPEGRLRISWRTWRSADGQHRFGFEWREMGGPPVAPPRRRGFGTLMMSRAFDDIDGTSRLTHSETGVCFTVDAPVTGRLGTAVKEPPGARPKGLAAE